MAKNRRHTHLGFVKKELFTGVGKIKEIRRDVEAPGLTPVDILAKTHVRSGAAERGRRGCQT